MRFFVRVNSVLDTHTVLQRTKDYAVTTSLERDLNEDCILVVVESTENVDDYNVCQMDMSEAYPVVPIPNSEFITFDGRL